MDLRHALLDNPILTRFVRSRLRRSQLLPSVAVVAVLTLLIAWWGYIGLHSASGGVARFAFGLQGIVLVFVGASQIGVSLGAARESGILDFHRISPLPPSVTTVGFFLGGPIREYLLALIPIPLLLASVATGGLSPGDLLQGEASLLLIAWVFHVAALLSSLISRRPTRNGAVGLIVLGVLAFGSLPRWLTVPAADDQTASLTLPFFGLRLPWLLWLAIYTLPPVAFGLLAASRKMQSDRAHLLSKPQAVAFLATMTALVLGAFVVGASGDVIDPVVLYLLAAFGIMTSLTIVPTLGEYSRGLRRAQRQGRAHLPAWDDLALNRPALTALCAIVLLGGSILFWRQDAAGARPPHLSLAVAVTVLTVAYVGLAQQWLALVMATRAGTLLGLLMFLVWVVPLLAGTILSIANAEGPTRDILFGLSPLSSIGALSASGPRIAASDALRLASLVPAIGLSLLFNNLVTIQRRKVDAAVRDARPAKPSPFEPDLAGV